MRTGGRVCRRPSARVFTPFHRLGTEGAGLGLSLVRQIAGLHGGEATVARAGVPSCFRVMLPA